MEPHLQEDEDDSYYASFPPNSQSAQHSAPASFPESSVSRSMEYNPLPQPFPAGSFHSNASYGTPFEDSSQYMVQDPGSDSQHGRSYDLNSVQYPPLASAPVPWPYPPPYSQQQSSYFGTPGSGSSHSNADWVRVGDDASFTGTRSSNLSRMQSASGTGFIPAFENTVTNRVLRAPAVERISIDPPLDTAQTSRPYFKGDMGFDPQGPSTPDFAGLKCEDCNKSFRTPSSLKKHRLTHTRPEKCQYQDCALREDGFPTKNELDRHIRTMHTKDALYTCSIGECDVNGGAESFPRLDYYKKHLRKAHGMSEEDSTQLTKSAKQSQKLSQCGSRMTEQDVLEEGNKFQPLFGRPARGSVEFNSSHIGGWANDHLREPAKLGMAGDNMTLEDASSFLDTPMDVDSHDQLGALIESRTCPDNMPSMEAMTVEADPSVPHIPQIRVSQPFDAAETRARNMVPYHGEGYQQDFSQTLFSQPSLYKPGFAQSGYSGPDQFAQGSPSTPSDRPSPNRQRYQGGGNHAWQTTQATLEPLPMFRHSREGSFYPGPTSSDVLPARSSHQESAPPAAGMVQESGLRQRLRQLDTVINQNQSQEVIDYNRSYRIESEGASTPGEAVPPHLRERARDLQRAGFDVVRKAGFVMPSTPSASIVSLRTPATSDERHSRAPIPGCSKCSEKANNKSELKKHLKRHYRDYFCTFPGCIKTFGSKNDWKRHENSQHWHFETWVCQALVPSDKSMKRPCGWSNHHSNSFRNHTEKEHSAQVNCKDRNILKAWMSSCRDVHGAFQDSYWCGFCQKWRDFEGSDVDAHWRARFTHIDQHNGFREGWVVQPSLNPPESTTRGHDCDAPERYEPQTPTPARRRHAPVEVHQEESYAVGEASAPIMDATILTHRPKRHATGSPELNHHETKRTTGTSYSVTEPRRTTVVTGGFVETSCCQCGEKSFQHRKTSDTCLNFHCSHVFCRYCKQVRVVQTNGEE